MAQKIFRSLKYKPFRKDKRRFANRETITSVTETPTGKIIEKKTAEYKTQRHFVPNKKNGCWKTVFYYGRFSIRHSQTSDRYFFYHDDKYLEEISRPEMYEFFKRGLQSIGGFREEIHERKKGVIYKRIMLKLDSTWRRENGF
jgi:hypothetical protein